MNPMKLTTKCASAFLMTLGLLASPAYAENIPVMVINDDPGLDICGSSASVVGLNPNGDNFLALRTAPSSRSGEKIAELPPDTRVTICDIQGEWYGVVVGFNGADCGLTQESYPVINQEYPYQGPCLSGWVYGKYLGNFAG